MPRNFFVASNFNQQMDMSELHPISRQHLDVNKLDTCCLEP